MTTSLEITGVSKAYSGPALFSDLTFEAARGLTAVAGPNGSGKTTLLKILAGLVRPSAGTVRLRRDGHDLSGDARRLAVGWMGPDLSFYEDFTAEENLRFFRRAAGWTDDPEEARRRLDDVGLEKTTHSRRVGDLSTGMRQRLRLAFATLFDPPILLLDEPTLGLDLEGRAAAARIVAAHRERGAVLVASNDERDFVSPDAFVRLGTPSPTPPLSPSGPEWERGRGGEGGTRQ
jgi:ABC-type multidrug transport system ATPase subunit